MRNHVDVSRTFDLRTYARFHVIRHVKIIVSLIGSSIWSVEQDFPTVLFEVIQDLILIFRLEYNRIFIFNRRKIDFLTLIQIISVVKIVLLLDVRLSLLT